MEKVIGKSPAIEVGGVSKNFKDILAVNDLTISIDQGEFVALLGPNGAGKTTLIEMIEGLQPPSSGTIKVFGKHWHGNEDFLHHQLGISLQETRFIDKLRVSETLALFASFYGLEASRIDEVLWMIALEDKKKAYVVNLSGGQRQRLALGVGLLNRPKLLLLDEPTTGLDPRTRNQVWDTIRRLVAKGSTILLTTQYLDEADQLADRIAVIDRGRVIAEGTPRELKTTAGVTTLQLHLADGEDTKEAERIIQSTLEVKVLTPGPLHITAPMADPERITDLLIALRKENIKLAEVSVQKPTLDEVFLVITGDKKETKKEGTIK